MIKKHAMAKSARRAGRVTSVHLTETCEEKRPHLITHVATTAATTTDEAMTETIHADAAADRSHPASTLARVLALSRHRSWSRASNTTAFCVIGPGHPDVKWQANTDDGIDVSQFRLDWDQKPPTCPQGHTSMSWTPALDHRKNEVIKIKFSTTDCGSCPLLTRCTRSEKKYKRRTITVRPQAQHEALQAARRRPQTPAFAKEYALREGIEATISEAGACLWHAPLPLYWPGQNAFAASWHCRGEECWCVR